MEAIRRAMRAALDLRPGARVLDAGCGVGLEAARLADEHPHAHVTGLDRNVHDTLSGALDRELGAKIAAWLGDVERATAGGGLLAAFTGVLTTARTG